MAEIQSIKLMAENVAETALDTITYEGKTIREWAKIIIAQELDNDCISRSRAIERLKLNFPTSQGDDNSRNRHRYMQAMADLQAIKELPPVRPKAKQGHWVKRNLGWGCSECNLCTNDRGMSMYYYCPQCGAKMDIWGINEIQDTVHTK